MALSAENKQFDSEGLLEYFRFRATGNDSTCSATYSLGVNLFLSYLCGSDTPLLPDPETAVTDWVVHLWANGTTYKTALTYINCVAGLYNKAVKEGKAPATDVFRELKAIFKQKGEKLWNTWLTKQESVKLLNLLRIVTVTTPGTAARMLLYSVTNGCSSLSDVAKLKIHDVSQGDVDLLGVDTSQFCGNRKYLFQLNQSQLTPKQLAKTANDRVVGLLALKNIGHSITGDDTIRSYWAYAALSMGVAPHIVRSFLQDTPSGVKILSVCRQENLSQQRRNELTTSVAQMFSANPLHWYVMRLRPRVKYSELEKRFDLLRGILVKPEIFYPCEEIHRRVGRKTKMVSEPVIPDIVFFKSRETDIYPMFLKIGDLAWCYRRNGGKDSTYAPVPKRAFEAFQETIGQFTPDYEVAPLGGFAPEIGNEIVVVGGMFQNQEGNIRSIEGQLNDNNKIYRIEIVPENGTVWKIGVDARIVRKKN